ncbi:MAG: PEP-utilizing enzyme [Syntrophobacterales bacterium]|nr:PEP-utilizing enzyme [Syntrophobacterales bacterium]
MNRSLSDVKLYSDALEIHMQLTRKAPIEIDPLFMLLKEVVNGARGLEQQAETLLKEYHHRYKNWQVVLDETKRYVISNQRFWEKHPLRGRIIFLLGKIILDAFLQTTQPQVKSVAIDEFIVFLNRIVDSKTLVPLISEIPNRNLEIEDALMVDELQGNIIGFFLNKLLSLEEEHFFILLNSFYSLKPLIRKLSILWSHNEEFLKLLRELLYRILKTTYNYWLSQEDPFDWLRPYLESEKEIEALKDSLPIGASKMASYEKQLLETRGIEDHLKALSILIELPDYRDIVRAYEKFPEELHLYPIRDTSRVRMIVRLKISQTKGLEIIQEEMLNRVNRELSLWLKNQTEETLAETIDTVMEILKTSITSYPEPVLRCVRTFGIEIVSGGNKKLIDLFMDRIISLGFQTAQVKGVNTYWQVQVNNAHILNVRVWLDIIKCNPQLTKPLLSALIVYISLTGTCIRDTDLFQRDVSALLHAPIGPVYNLVKQLARLFPVYFNEIGAEGLLRSVSTEVDEIHGRGDPLVHFLRKQSHVESNNLTVPFIEAIFKFWYSLDPSHIKPFLPNEIYSTIDISSPFVMYPHRLIKALFDETIVNRIEDLLDINEETLKTVFDRIKEVPYREKQRVALMVKFYQLLYEKYNLDPKEIVEHLQRGAQLGLPNPSNLIKSLQDESNIIVKLENILDYLSKLKNLIIEPSEMKAQENIYIKRHIAVDIPSMYGSYNEKKFDALGLTFRLENLANVLFEELLQSFDLSFITRATFSEILKVFPLFIRALEIEGIRSTQLERYYELFEKALEVRRFSHSQYMDIFRGFSEATRQIITLYYHIVHEHNLNRIIPRLKDYELLPKYRSTSGITGGERLQKLSETVLRDFVARTFGLQYFDNFVTRILNTLSHQKSLFSPQSLDLLLSYEPQKTITPIYHPPPSLYDAIHLGNKGYNLVTLHELGINVPPGFIITTEYFRCRKVIDHFSEAKRDFHTKLRRFLSKLEAETDRCFGCPTNTLLLSVRSGATMSMPGMMTTFLNVGINEEIVEGLIKQTGEAWFAWDNYRRFLQSWGMSFGIPRNEFDIIMKTHKERRGRKFKREFTPEEMREVARDYRRALERFGVMISDDPWEQLLISINQVIESWNAPKAKTYREIMGISDNWGTAVTVQAMVFGNLDQNSGAGVMFTHNTWAAEEDIDPNGDFTLGNQGEDVVGGLVKTLPISEKQRLREAEPRETSLEKLFPDVYKKLVEIAEELVYRQHWGPQEIEFTFQGSSGENLYILQSRNMTPRITRRYRVFVPTPKLVESYLASGIGVSGEALSGRIAFDLDSIDHLRKEFPGDPIIFIRPDTVPDDIKEISSADGILTGKGGATSHAAIVAHRLGKTCVVGCSKMTVWEQEHFCSINGRVFRTGDIISLDGRSGAIYEGFHETKWEDEIIAG